ncbi:MAG: metallophosphoesterase, partial [Bacteroidota bacterium]
FNESFVVDIFKDNFSAAHPMAAITLADMADAAGVYHTNPQIVYMAKQPALGEYNDLFGGELYLFEERPDDDWRDLPSFGNSKKIVSTYDVLEKITEKHGHKIDQAATIRARLFDILIGDWDRHDDQWRWASFKDKEKDETIYRPIPRDRDQVYSKYDGVLFGILRYTIPFLKQLRKYDPKIPADKIKWVNYHSRHFDRTFLTEGDWSDWEAAANHIKDNVTDEVIEAAIKKWPANVYAVDGEETIKVLKQRRDDMLEYAKGLYGYLAKKVDVLGTDKKDYFLVQRQDNEHTRVMVFDTNKELDKIKAVEYARVFKNSETDEISLYGMGDDDVFEIEGDVNQSILIRAIGGLGEDHFIDSSNVMGGSHNVIIYDAKEEKTTLDIGAETFNAISDRPTFNQYNHRGWDYEMDYAMPLIAVGRNPDDGFLLTGQVTFTKYGFKKDPYQSVQTFGGQVALETGAFAFNYSGEWIDAFGKWELLMDVELRGPLYARNYYGLGNETINNEDIFDDDYHRIRHRQYSIYPAIKKRFAGQSGGFSFGPLFELSEVKRTEGRFIDEIGDELDPEVFENQNFIGGRMLFNYQNLDKLALPNRGIDFRTALSYRINTGGNTNSFPTVESALAIYQNIGPPGILTFGTRAGVTHNFTNDFEFYQAAVLGGNGPNPTLRGFRRDRFSGRTAFYHNTDLRLKLANLKTKALPLSMGIFGGF